MQESIEQLQTTLKQAGFSLTSARKIVFIAMLDQEPMTMNDLSRKIGTTINRSSMYRVIEVFEQLGITQRLQLGWKYKLELSDSFASHHHHLSCIRCGNVQPFEESSTISFELKQLAQESGFTETGHQLEIRGICSRCKL